MAILPETHFNKHENITIGEAKQALSTGTWGDSAALKLTIQDASRADNYTSTKEWVMNWMTASTLYQSPYTVRYWENTQTERSNVPFFTVATAVNSLVPQIIKGLFYDDPPFLAQNRPGTTAQEARAMSSVLAYQLEEIQFREQLRLGVTTALLYGTTIWKYGWEIFSKERVTYERKIKPLVVPDPVNPGKTQEIYDDDEEVEEKRETIEVHRPTFETVTDLKQILVDPGLAEPNIQKAKYVIHRMYVTWDDLEDLRERPGINLPSRDELLQLFFPPIEKPQVEESLLAQQTPLWDARAEPPFEDTTADPFEKPLELMERWDNKRYILVLQKKLVIASTENPFGCIPFFSLGWWDVPGAFWSMGLARTIGSEQRLQAGIMNTWLDGVSLMLNGVYVRVRGTSVPTQNIRMAPGKVIDVDTKDALTPLDRAKPIPEAMQAYAASVSRAETVSGASEPGMQGVAGTSGHSNLARSATGANMLAGGAGSRVEEFIEKLSTNVLIPLLDAFHDLNTRLLPLKLVRQILDKELAHTYIKEAQGDLINLKNARVKFSIRAAAKLLARRNMAQALPIMLQFLQAGPIIEGLAVSGQKVDVKELVRMMFEVSDWKNINDVIVDMTPADQQRWMAQQQASKEAVKQKGAQQLQAQKTNDQFALNNDENIARAGREVMRQAMEQASSTDEVTGQPGGPGFGSNS